MNYRTFGKTQWRISEVGLGTWQLGADWGAVDETTAAELLSTATDKGVNFFDTADVYGGGRSESIIGKFLTGCSEKIYVATKLGRLEGYPAGYSFELFSRCVENSLRRLKLETLDLVQLHCIPTSYMASGEVFDWLRRLAEQGKIQAFGASVETVDEAHLCLKQPDIASLQIIFNIFRQTPADTLFSAAEKNGTALIVRLPLASGLLSGKMNSNTAFAPSDHRTYNRNGEAFNAGETFSGLDYAHGLQLVDKIKCLLPPAISMAQAAIRWILDYKEVSVVIPGATKITQIEGNTGASDAAPLSPQIHAALRLLYDTEIEGKIRGRV